MARTLDNFFASGRKPTSLKKCKIVSIVGNMSSGTLPVWADSDDNKLIALIMDHPRNRHSALVDQYILRCKTDQLFKRKVDTLYRFFSLGPLDILGCELIGLNRFWLEVIGSPIIEFPGFKDFSDPLP